jgi:hypothetical protein
MDGDDAFPTSLVNEAKAIIEGLSSNETIRRLTGVDIAATSSSGGASAAPDNSYPADTFAVIDTLLSAGVFQQETPISSNNTAAGRSEDDVLAVPPMEDFVPLVCLMLIAAEALSPSLPLSIAKDASPLVRSAPALSLKLADVLDDRKEDDDEEEDDEEAGEKKEQKDAAGASAKGDKAEQQEAAKKIDGKAAAAPVAEQKKSKKVTLKTIMATDDGTRATIPLPVISGTWPSLTSVAGPPNVTGAKKLLLERFIATTIGRLKAADKLLTAAAGGTRGWLAPSLLSVVTPFTLARLVRLISSPIVPSSTSFLPSAAGSFVLQLVLQSLHHQSTSAAAAAASQPAALEATTAADGGSADASSSDAASSEPRAWTLSKPHVSLEVEVPAFIFDPQQAAQAQTQQAQQAQDAVGKGNNESSKPRDNRAAVAYGSLHSYPLPPSSASSSSLLFSSVRQVKALLAEQGMEGALRGAYDASQQLLKQPTAGATKEEEELVATCVSEGLTALLATPSEAVCGELTAVLVGGGGPTAGAGATASSSSAEAGSTAVATTTASGKPGIRITEAGSGGSSSGGGGPAVSVLSPLAMAAAARAAAAAAPTR